MTPAQIDDAQEFHTNGCAKIEGPRGGVTYKIERWRRNGATKRWKTWPERFRIPIKYGMRDYWELTQVNVEQFHAAVDCPVEELR